MPAPKLVHIIDGKRWLRVAHAAKLLRATSARVREWMGDGTLEWRQLKTNSTNFVVAERDVAALALALVTAKQEAARDAPAKKVRSVVRRRGPASYMYKPPSPDDPVPRGPGVFDRTWDPSPGPEAPARVRRKTDDA